MVHLEDADLSFPLLPAPTIEAVQPEDAQQPISNLTKLALLPEPSPVSPAEIFEAISNASPLSQEDVANRYEGIVVRWELLYSSASAERWAETGDNVNVILNPAGNLFRYVLCTVALSDYLFS